MAEEIINSTGAEGTGGENTEKKFTQADVDRIVGERLARERKGGQGEGTYLSEAELADYRAYKATQQTEAQKLSDVQSQLDAANAKVTKYEQESLLKSKGVGDDELEFYAFKIGQMVDDKTTFEAAAESFLKDKQLSKGTPKIRIEMGAGLESGAGSKSNGSSDFMNNLIRNARK